MNTEDSAPKAGVVLLIVACLVVRLVALSADPPPWLSWSTGVYTDEGFYTLDARHEALFHTWAPGNFHDRLLSPLLSLIQQGIFAVFGPRLIVARLIAVGFGLLTVWVFWLGLRRVWGARTAFWGAVFLGLAPPFVFYNRMALQETPTVFWLVLAFTLWTYGRDSAPRKRAIYLCLTGVSVVVALTFKALALIALPAFAWAWWRIRPPAPNSGGAGMAPVFSVLAPPVLGAGGALLLYLLLWYAPHHAELARMDTYYRVHQFQPHSFKSVLLSIRRGVVGGERGVVPYLLALMPVPCLLAGWGIRGKGDDAANVLTIWLLCGLGFCLVSSYAPSRYYVLYLPPLAGLAAVAMGRLRRSRQSVVLVLFLVTAGLWSGRAWTHRAYARRDAAQMLARTLPPGSRMIGDLAPALCLDTQFAAAPVQVGLSNDNHPVERLQAGYIAVVRAPVWEHWWSAHYPAVIQPSHHVAAFILSGPRQYVVDVYKVATQENQTAVQKRPSYEH